MRPAFFVAMLVLSVLPGCVQGAATWASSCPTGQKLAAGACVRQCPGGYSDQGSVCILVNQR
jgi:hypothetical protein